MISAVITSRCLIHASPLFKSEMELCNRLCE
jgi:hypothetical protein